MVVPENKIHVALAFDQNFIIPFYVLITSIFKNNKENKIVLHAIAAGVDTREREKITRFVQQNQSQIFFYELDKAKVETLVLPDNVHFSAATYYRLFFPSLVPQEIKKLLYIDTDTVVVGNLAELYRVNVDAVPAAAALDAKISLRPDLGINTAGHYFNAGVMLINTELWKSQHILEKALQYLHDFPERIEWADQDALNALLQNNIVKVSNRFNITFYDIPKYLTRQEFDAFIQDKVIIHYTTQNKPWLMTCTNRLRYIYHDYLRLSPYATQQKYVDFKLNKPDVFKYLKVRLKEFLIDTTGIFRARSITAAV
ncbi:glycosyltransferase family 8 protein [Adhaeribacter rhizoryzae]|uniref:Glycosyltransferase family 8 protein n=1 Tax=Adhaeribacter rhizoryzae TaxID=2607907 RepID=A0A5M6DRF4_9BACT|nr:glycosyltransferase family 8 protein [Adhaeribacter rhizoryzae]KAA5548770.1 glycosyltransferase family 8 protein [Adhaeribacter rhizoryzae]